MKYPYRITFNDGTVSSGEANTRDVVLWETRFSMHHKQLERDGVPLAEFAWLVHAAERRQERTSLDLLEWLDTVDDLDSAAPAEDERDPLTGEGEGPLVPLAQVRPTG